MSFYNVLGMLGGFVASSGMLFQVHKTIRERAIKDISFSMLGANILGMIMVLVYSIGTKQPSIYIPLCLSLGCNVFLVGYKVRSIKPSCTVLEERGIILEDVEKSDTVLTEK